MSDKKHGFAKSTRSAQDLIDRSCDALRRQGEQMIALADKLGTNGRRLMPEEKELIRVAFLPEMKASAQQAVSNYVAGNKQYFDCDVEHMATVFSDIDNL